MESGDLRVVIHLASDMFDDVGDCPTWEDDAHVYYPALGDDGGAAGSEYEELLPAIESGGLDPYARNWFVLSRPEPDAALRLAAIRRYFGQ